MQTNKHRNVAKPKISFRSESRRAMGYMEDMQKMFLLVKKYITIRVEKNFIRKMLDHDIVFEFKIFSYIKAFFNNIVSTAEIKDASEVKIMFYFTCPLICSRYCTENKSKLKKGKSKLLRQTIQMRGKGNQNEP